MKHVVCFISPSLCKKGTWSNFDQNVTFFQFSECTLFQDQFVNFFSRIAFNINILLARYHGVYAATSFAASDTS